RPGYRDLRGGPAAYLRALLPRRSGALAPHRRVGTGAGDREARGAAARRRGAHVVATRPRIDLHDPARAGGPARRRLRLARPAGGQGEGGEEGEGREEGECREGRPSMTRVLLVEDEPDLADPLAYLLRREGYEVDVAEDG